MAKQGADYTNKAGFKRKGDKNPDISAIGDNLGGFKPPQAIEIEEAVLAAMLLEPDVISDILDQISEDCFYKETHRKIFSAIATLSRRSDPVDILTVADELQKAGNLEEVGGMAFLSALSLKIGAAAHVEYHTKVLLQKYVQRELISISYDIQKKSFDDSLPVDELIETAEHNIFSLAEKNMKRETRPVDSIINQAINEIEAGQEREDGLSGVPSCYTGIDKITFGWQASDLIIVAARPAVGKTAFVLTMARNMAVERSIPVAFFSLEMPGTQLVKRLMTAETGLPVAKIRGAVKMTNEEWARLNDGMRDLARAPLWIDDTPSLSIYEFKSKARRLVNNSKVKMIIIDYLQLMTGPPELRGMREQEVSAISRALKAIAKELNVPIIALSQLNRSVETRGGNRRPQLSDLRESGALEQDADIVMFIHRLDPAVDENIVEGDTDLIIAKHRNGEVADVPMRFISAEAKFIDRANTQLYQPEQTPRYEQHQSKMNSFPAMSPGSEFD